MLIKMAISLVVAGIIYMAGGYALDVLYNTLYPDVTNETAKNLMDLSYKSVYHAASISIIMVYVHGFLWATRKEPDSYYN